MHLFKKRFLPAIAIMAIPVGLIIIEDFGTAALITLLTVMILLIGGANWKHVLAPAPLGVLAFVGAILAAPHRIQRLAAFWNPEKWADTVAYQANQSLIALGSGGLFGKGIGCGVSKYGHLPEDTTDFIFAIIGEEMGFVGTVAVIALFIAFVWLGIKVVKNCADEYGKFLAATIVMTIGTQAALNIGVVTVVLPTKGLPLPFVSAGGTSMLLTAAAVGILLNIAKQIAPKSEPVAASAPSATAQFQMQIIEHKEALASLEQQAAELSDTDEQFEVEYAQTQMEEYHDEPEHHIMPLNVAKKPLKRDASEPLDTQELEKLSGIAKKLAGK
jgi:cell division protein FtsW